MHLNPSLLKQILSIAFVVVFLGYMLAIGVVMLFWPEAWFRLPYGLALRGGLRRESTSNLHVRMLGLVFTSAILWVAQAIVLHEVEPQIAGRVRAILGAAICAGTVGCGFSMLLRPRFWLERFVVEKGPPLDASLTEALAWGIRVLSTLAILVGGYGLWKLIGAR